ncbi:hypothetical protein [Streptomyces iranensis]|uniref:hypothetical protein n=1 Tax=Streptomyces iranensis TaxID=576784 RepID=UPI0039B75B19
MVVLAIGLALTLGILRPGLLAAIGRRRLLTAPGALAGLVTGEAVVTWLTLAEVETHHVNAGLVALAVNVLVAVAVTALFPRPAASPTMDSALGAHEDRGAHEDHEDHGAHEDRGVRKGPGPKTRTRAAMTTRKASDRDDDG